MRSLNRWAGASALALLFACGGTDETGTSPVSAAGETAHDASVASDGGGAVFTVNSGGSSPQSNGTGGTRPSTSGGNDAGSGVDEAPGDASTPSDDATLPDANDAGSTADGGDTGSADAAGSDDAASDAPSAPLVPPDVHFTGRSLSVDGRSRTYDLSVPLVCTTAARVPIVIVLHGDLQRGSDMYTQLPIEAAAHAAGDDAVFVYPDGLNNNQNNSAWNIYDDPGVFPYAKVSPSGNSDVDLFDAIVPAIAASTACADASRVYLTGFSNGGFMTTQLARWRPSAFKAAAPQSSGEPAGTAHSDYAPPNYCVGTTGALPVLIIHGLSDTMVAPSFAEKNASYWDMANSCDQSAQDCSANGDVLAAPPATPTVPVSPSPCVSSTGCAAGKSVTFCLIPGMQHEIWSGAPATVWSFFAANGAHG